jgi:transposase
MLFGRETRRILAYRHPVDMRRSFDGLLGLVQGVLREDPLSGTLFTFFNRRGNLLKLLFWDRTGFCVFAKRLERNRFVLPGDGDIQELSVRALELILDGISLDVRRRLGAQGMHDARRESSSARP